MESVCFGCFCDSLDGCGICTVCGYDHRKNREACPQALSAGTVLHDRYLAGKVLEQDQCSITYLAQDCRTKNLVTVCEFFPTAAAVRTGGITVEPLSDTLWESFLCEKNNFREKAENATGESSGSGDMGLYFEENGTGYYVKGHGDGVAIAGDCQPVRQLDDDATVTFFTAPAAVPAEQPPAAPIVLQSADPAVPLFTAPAVSADAPAAPGKQKKRGKKILLAVACAVLLLAVGFAAFWLFHPHSYEDWEEVKAAACTEAGLRQRVCFCGNVEKEEIAALGHTEQIMEAIPATCLESGLTEGLCCSVCNAVLTQQEILPATGHELLTLEAVAATCTESGLSVGYECKNCTYLQVKQNEVPALGHRFDNNECKRCGTKEWWIIFLSAKESYAVGERIEIHLGLRSDTSTEAIALRCKISYKNDYGYSNSTDDPMNDGKGLAAGENIIVYWDSGIQVKMTVTISICDENGNELGSYTFQVE